MYINTSKKPGLAKDTKFLLGMFAGWAIYGVPMWLAIIAIVYAGSHFLGG